MFQNAREIVSVFGFKIRIHASWFIIAALIVWSLSSSYFPERLPDETPVVLISISVISMIGLFLSLILHELAHATVARQFNLDVGSITLFIFGGVAELERDPESAKSEFWIALAGPVMSFVLSGLFFAVSPIVHSATGSALAAEVLQYLGMINMVLAIFNLVPAFPLDGGRIMRSVIWHWKNDILSATRIATRIGEFFGLLLITVGVLAFFTAQTLIGIWQIMIGLFIFSASRSCFSDLVIRQTLKHYSVSALMTRQPWVADVNDTIKVLVDQIMLKNNVSFIPVIEGNELLGYVDAAMIKTIDRENWHQTKVGDVFAPRTRENTATAEARTEDVFDQMLKTGNRKLLIARNGRLEGVISLSDLMTFLSIRSGLGLGPDDTRTGSHKTVAHV